MGVYEDIAVMLRLGNYSRKVAVPTEVVLDELLFGDSPASMQTPKVRDQPTPFGRHDVCQ